MKNVFEKYRAWFKGHPLFSRIKQIVGFCVLVIAVVLCVIIRFSNPELTETQLFLENFLEYLAAIALMGIAAFCFFV